MSGCLILIQRHEGYDNAPLPTLWRNTRFFMDTL
jgi:hypothetical protein